MECGQNNTDSGLATLDHTNASTMVHGGDGGMRCYAKTIVVRSMALWLGLVAIAMAFPMDPRRRTRIHASLSSGCGASTHNAGGDRRSQTLWTRDDISRFAEDQGIEITLSKLGPGFRSTARSLQNRTDVLGYVEGFTRGQILHLDKMEVFRKKVKQVRATNEKFTGGGTGLGVGMLMGYICLLHGAEAGCRTAEFLAIDDGDYLHRRLVRLYTTAGFEIVKYVGDDLRDVPDRLVWGGCGTLMRKDIDSLAAFWSNVLARSLAKKNERG